VLGFGDRLCAGFFQRDVGGRAGPLGDRRKTERVLMSALERQVATAQMTVHGRLRQFGQLPQSTLSSLPAMTALRQ
jgi:hypothetical protein